jgi:SAM-dependent methyltransferase
MEIKMEDEARLVRERDYHNGRVIQETRDSQGKYYAAINKGSHFEKALVRLSANADILEYGCGNLPILFSGALHLPDICKTATGIDISDLAVDASSEKAIKMGLKNVGFQTMNAEQMTFSDASFDLVFGRGIIHHLDTDRSFAEISRVLRPDGIALFWEPLGHNLALNLYRRLTPSARTSDEHPLVREDFKIAQRHFAQLNLSFCGLTTILSVPWRDTKFGDTLLAMTETLDQGLFYIPGVKWQAWYCLMEMVKEQHGRDS